MFIEMEEPETDGRHRSERTSRKNDGISVSRRQGRGCSRACQRRVCFKGSVPSVRSSPREGMKASCIKDRTGHGGGRGIRHWEPIGASVLKEEGKTRFFQ